MIIDAGRLAIYKAIKHQLPEGMQFNDFMETLKDYTVIPIIINNKCVGGYGNNGNEVHAAAMDKYHGKWYNRRVIRWLNHLIEVYGFLITCVEHENKSGHKFVKRIGFKPFGINDQSVIYRLEAL